MSESGSTRSRPEAQLATETTPGASAVTQADAQAAHGQAADGQAPGASGPTRAESAGAESARAGSAGAGPAGADTQRAESLRAAVLGGAPRYDQNEISRARAVIWLNVVFVSSWVLLNCAAGWWLHNARPIGVAAAGLAMAGCFGWSLRLISGGRMAKGVAVYTVSGLLLLLAMGLFVPELALLFTFATFIFLAFGLSYMSGRASMQVVALTIAVALVLLLASEAFRWTSGVPNDVYRWFNLTGMLMALSLDATMFVMLRRTLEARGQRLVQAERGAAEMQRRIAQQERLESIGKLAGGVAHDFNNVLAVVLNYAAFIAEAVEDRPEVLRDVEQVQSAAQRAAALTRKLLIFGRRDLAHDDAADLNEVVEATESLLRSVVGESIELRTKLAAGVPKVRMDTTHIEQILLNLSVNARDAMPGGGLLLIETSEREFGDEESGATRPEPGRYACLSVSDTGTGFTEEARQHAFEPFFTTKPEGRGTGLGLATLYGIAKNAGGDIRLYSERGIGTTIRVYIPEAASADAPNASAPTPRPVETDGGGRTVLVVEDEPQLRQVATRILERQNYRVCAPESSEAALAVLRGKAPLALLLTDVVMPGISGLQLAEEAARLRPQLNVLFMSGFPRDLWERGAIDENLAIIEKPFDSQDLLRRVFEVVSPDLAAEPSA
jgi:signal transduction histidine kinase/CheY-like chemotaxis protein